jgi:UrcA family protein
MNRRLKITMMMSALALGYQMAYATPPQDDPPSVVVHFGDLDLTRSDGVAVLYRRLKYAAETVCDSQDGDDLASKRRYETCWQDALSRAVFKVDRPALIAYYRARSNDHSGSILVARK